MRITRTEQGDTTVDLIILTPNPLAEFPGYPMHKIELMHDLITVNNVELEPVSQDLHGLFPPRQDVTLRIWQIKGQLNSFTHDLLAH